MREKEENVEGMITAITVNLDTRSWRDSEGGGSAKCYSKARQLQQRITAVGLDDWEVLDALQECCLEGKGVSFVKEVAGGSLRKWRQWLQHNCAGNLVSSIRRD